MNGRDQKRCVLSYSRYTEEARVCIQAGAAAASSGMRGKEARGRQAAAGGSMAAEGMNRQKQSMRHIWQAEQAATAGRYSMREKAPRCRGRSAQQQQAAKYSAGKNASASRRACRYSICQHDAAQSAKARGNRQAPSVL